MIFFFQNQQCRYDNPEPNKVKLKAIIWHHANTTHYHLAVKHIDRKWRHWVWLSEPGISSNSSWINMTLVHCGVSGRPSSFAIIIYQCFRVRQSMFPLTLQDVESQILKMFNNYDWRLHCEHIGGLNASFFLCPTQNSDYQIILW